jgi:hypothetical protein
MKFFLSLGGSIGFFAAFFSALHAGSEIGFALRDGAIGCLAGALLMRGFHYIMILCIRSLVQEQADAVATVDAANGVN